MPKNQAGKEEVILNCIRRYGPISKANIAKRTEITPPTVSNICNKLLEQSLIFTDGEEQSAIGRPSLLLRFNNELEKFLIVHIRTHSVHFYVVNLGKDVLQQESFSIIDFSTEEIIESVYHQTEEMLSRYTGISAIGLILRGPVDSNLGISIYSPNGKWSNVPFKYILEERFNLPVYIDNDVRALATGEYYYGRGVGAHNLFVLKFSFGLGSSFMYEGELYRGHNENAGEIGAMLVKGDKGETVLLEQVASETALREYVLRSLAAGKKSSLQDNEIISRESFRVEPIYEAAVAGDELALEAMSHIGYYLGMAIVSVINLINPERIVISSAMKEAAFIMDDILRPMIEKYSHRTQPVELTYAENGSYYTVLGMIEIISAKRTREGQLLGFTNKGQ